MLSFRAPFVPVTLALAGMLFGCASPSFKPHPPASPAAPPPPQVTVTVPAVRPVTEYMEYPGRTAAVESVEVRARVGGYLESVAFRDGQEVKKGDLLFVIDPAPYRAALEQAQATQKSAEAKLRTQELDLARYRALVEKGAVPRQLMDQAMGAKNETVANRHALQAAVERSRLDLEYTRITAPISGLVSRTRVTAGNLVAANTTLFTTIVSVDPIYVYFDVDEATVLRARRMIRERKLKSYKDARFPVYLGLASEQGFPHEGVIDFVENALDPGTGTLGVRGVFANADRGLSPGIFGRVRFPLGGPHQALLIPERALNTDQRGDFVKVVGPGDVVQDRVIKTGKTEGPMIVVESGLRPDERVVVSGLQKARPGARVVPKLESPAVVAVSAR